MAAGVTTGVVALMLQAHQLAEPNAPAAVAEPVKAILQFSSSSLKDDSGSSYDVLTQGTGEINAARRGRAVRGDRHDGGRWATTG